MAGHAGLDVDYYPGNQAMKWLLEETNLAWTGLYLPVAGPGLGAKATWKGKYGFLKASGWGVAPIYVGKQRNSIKLRAKAGAERLEGYMDGTEAAKLASQETIPHGCVLYFDFEGGDYPTKAWLDYFTGWVQAVLDQHYMPGIYCSYLVVKNGLLRDLALRNNRPEARPVIWAINYKLGIGKAFPDPYQIYPTDEPADSGVLNASCWQLGGNCRIFWETKVGKQVQKMPLKVDLDTSVFLDPGLRA
jgi:hypothetical protein